MYEIWANGIAEECGGKHLEIVVKTIEEDDDQERYFSEISKLINDIKKILSERNIGSNEALKIQKCWIVDRNTEIKSRPTKSILLLEDVKHLGFKDVAEEFPDGLDYEHSVLTISNLARFHAASYVFRKTARIDWTEEYPLISSNIDVPRLPKEMVSILEDIFKESSDFSKYSWLFMGPPSEKMDMINRKVDTFGVLSHGNCIKQNLVFQYRKAVDLKRICSDVIFKDPCSYKFSSCVVDLLQFIFTSMEPMVRQSFMADFVCSVYYDNFVKTVSSIDSSIPVFSKKSFIKEFDQNIIYGFLFSLHHLSGNNEGSPRSLKKQMMESMRDLIQFKINTKATLYTGPRVK